MLSPLICFEQIKIERLVRCPVDIIGIGAYVYLMLSNFKSI
ncbi:MAG: hypothetical protein ACLRQF_02935 [Thomasclavelia ramosa]